jgi:hypothetical protein
MATKVFLHDLDLNLNQLLNAKFQILATDPVSPIEGQFWYNSADDRVKYYDGTSTQQVANLNDIVGLLNYKGSYDAAGNTPNLTTPAVGAVEKGDVYTVTVAGNFFTESVQVGDMLIAEIDDPSSLANWTVVEQNLNAASETVAGYIRIATQAETDAGVSDTITITPLKLATYLSNLNYTQKYSVDLNGAVEVDVVRVFGGGQTTFTVTHGLNTLDVQVEAREIATGDYAEFSIQAVTANTVDLKANGNIADGVYRTVIIG